MVSAPSERAIFATTGAPPVPVPPPSPAVTNTMSAPLRTSSISSRVVLGGLAADLGVGAGAEAARELAADVELDVGVADEQRLRVGVDRDELDALEPDLDHPVDGVDTAAADPHDLDHREVVLWSRHVPSFRRRPRRPRDEPLCSAKGIELCQPLAPVDLGTARPRQAERRPPAPRFPPSAKPPPAQPVSALDLQPQYVHTSSRRAGSHPCVHVNAHPSRTRVSTRSTPGGRGGLERPGGAAVSGCRDSSAAGRGSSAHARRAAVARASCTGGLSRSPPGRPSGPGCRREHQPYVGGGAGGRRAEPGTQRRGRSVITVTAAVRRHRWQSARADRRARH